LAWTSFALNYAVAVVISDFCVLLDEAVTTNTTNNAVSVYLDCEKLLGFQDVRTQLYTQLNASYSLACNNVGRLVILLYFFKKNIKFYFIFKFHFKCDGDVEETNQPCPHNPYETCNIVNCPLPGNQCNQTTLRRYLDSTIADALVGCVEPSYYDNSTFTYTIPSTTPMSTARKRAKNPEAVGAW